MSQLLFTECDQKVQRKTKRSHIHVKPTHFAYYNKCVRVFMSTEMKKMSLSINGNNCASSMLDCICFVEKNRAQHFGRIIIKTSHAIVSADFSLRHSQNVIFNQYVLMAMYASRYKWRLDTTRH